MEKAHTDEGERGGGGRPSACLDIIKLPHSVEMNAQWYLIKSHSEQYYIMLQRRNILSDESLLTI